MGHWFMSKCVALVKPTQWNMNTSVLFPDQGKPAVMKLGSSKLMHFFLTSQSTEFLTLALRNKVTGIAKICITPEQQEVQLIKFGGVDKYQT